MTKEQICILIAMAVYMIAVVVIGVICARRNRTADDFYLGGRKLGPLVTAMSAEASDMSSWLLMGLPGGVSDGYIRRGLDGHRPGSGLHMSTGWWFPSGCAAIRWWPKIPSPCRISFPTGTAINTGS